MQLIGYTIIGSPPPQASKGTNLSLVNCLQRRNSGSVQEGPSEKETRKEKEKTFARSC